jgi:RIO kinase 1
MKSSARSRGQGSTVYLVRSGAHQRICAARRCFAILRSAVSRNLPDTTRGAWQPPSTRHRQEYRFGRKEQDAAWKNAEVEVLCKLVAAGLRVPYPYGYFNDTLIMELVTDATGDFRVKHRPNTAMTDNVVTLGAGL